MPVVKNKGKSFIRAEVTKEQKGHFETLAKALDLTTVELLSLLAERFIDNNLSLIDDYQSEVNALQEKMKNKVNLKVGVGDD